MTWRDACREKIRAILDGPTVLSAEQMGELIDLIAYEKEVSAREAGEEVKGISVQLPDSVVGPTWLRLSEFSPEIDQAVERTVGRIG